MRSKGGKSWTILIINIYFWRADKIHKLQCNQETLTENKNTRNSITVKSLKLTIYLLRRSNRGNKK